VAISTGVQTLSAEAVETLSASKHEPTWMRDRRLAAWQLSEELTLPLGIEEESIWSTRCR
jgi:Fe-S cluster assembly scaffold protein SufB